MRGPWHPAVLLVIVVQLAAPAVAQVGVETGLTGAGGAGASEPLRRLGTAVNRSVFGSAGAVSAARTAPPAAFSLSAAATATSRVFLPGGAGRYVAGVSWRQPGTTPVVLTAAGQEVSGTTAAPLLLRFDLAAAGPVTVGIRASAPPALGGLAGSLDVVREGPPGQRASKSLLTPAERLEAATAHGPRPSVLPLLANLAERHLRGAAPETDLDRTFNTALAAAGQVTPADLQALVRDYDDLPEAVRARRFTAQTSALRTLASPSFAQVSGLLARPGSGAGAGFSGGLVAAPPRLTGLLPQLPPGGAYAPGAVIRLAGENFAPRREDNRVHLGPQLSRLFSTPPLPVRSASPSALEFELPADLPEGPLYLAVIVRYKHPTSARPLRISKDGLNPAAAAAPGTAGRYRLSCRRLECVDESDPEWWADDEVLLLLDAVTDDRALTRIFRPAGAFGDGTAADLPEAEGAVLEATVSQGLGLVLQLSRCHPPDPPERLGPWTLREAFANALAAPQPQPGDPRPQDDVAGELAIQADAVGSCQLYWSAAELAQLPQPGQAREFVLDLRQGTTPEQSEASGHYRLFLSVERLQ